MALARRVATVWPLCLAMCFLTPSSRASRLVRQQGLRTATRQGQEEASMASAEHIDLVVERHCEDLSWLSELSEEVRPRLRLFIYNKPGKDCGPLDKAMVPADLHVEIEELENIARDGHDQLHHVAKHYDDLAPHTAFVQAGYHWTMRSNKQLKLDGWENQQDALNELIPKLTDDQKFIPLTAHSKEWGPMLYRDMEDDTDTENNLPETHVSKFKTGWSDMYNRGREMYAMLFGGTPCEAEGQNFTAGMQYIVHRDNLRQRSQKFWSSMRDKIVTCDPHFGYSLERLTTAIYNGTADAVDPDEWRPVSFCKTNLDWSSFTTPLDRMKTAEFWRKEWGCEPLSQRLLDMHSRGEI